MNKLLMFTTVGLAVASMSASAGAQGFSLNFAVCNNWSSNGNLTVCQCNSQTFYSYGNNAGPCPGQQQGGSLYPNTLNGLNACKADGVTLFNDNPNVKSGVGCSQQSTNTCKYTSPGSYPPTQGLPDPCPNGSGR